MDRIRKETLLFIPSGFPEWIEKNTREYLRREYGSEAFFSALTESRKMHIPGGYWCLWTDPKTGRIYIPTARKKEEAISFFERVKNKKDIAVFELGRIMRIHPCPHSEMIILEKDGVAYATDTEELRALGAYGI